VIKIVIPPLRQRREEILPLAEMLLQRHTPKGQKPPVILEPLKRFLLEYRWPGNVRELENVMRRFLVYQDAALLIQELVDGAEELRSGLSLTKVASFPDASTVASLRGESGSRDEAAGMKPPERVDRLDRLAEASRIAETELLLDALEASRWNRRQAAASLQIEYKAFLYKLQKYGIVESKSKRRDISA
jgi:two-component system response regulator AtoC